MPMSPALQVHNKAMRDEAKVGLIEETQEPGSRSCRLQASG